MTHALVFRHLAIYQTGLKAGILLLNLSIDLFTGFELVSIISPLFFITIQLSIGVMVERETLTYYGKEISNLHFLYL